MYKFILIPGSLISDSSLGDKRVLIYAAIFFSEWDGSDYYKLIKYSGYSLRKGTDGILRKYRDVVSGLIRKGYLVYESGKIRVNKHQERFSKISFNEFDKILCFRRNGLAQGKRINHSHLILLLAHIRLYMIRKEGYPVMYSNLLSRISENTSLSPRSVSSGIEALEQIGILCSEKLPRYKDSSGAWHSNGRIFVNAKSEDDCNEGYDWQKEIDDGKRIICAHNNER